ncbi:MAG: hypothetical protein ACXV3S_02000 [Kineosporiaceae bacterium]
MSRRSLDAGSRRRVTAVALATGLLLLPMLAGCGTRQAGAAAVIDDRRITVDDVQTSTQQIRHLQGAEEVTQEQVLLLLLAEPYAVDAANKANVGVSEADARKALEGSVSDPDQATVDLMRSNLALSALSQSQNGNAAVDQVLQQLAAASPLINPRYGRFDMMQKAIVPVTESWLSPGSSPGASTGGQPQPSPSPSPSPSS